MFPGRKVEISSSNEGQGGGRGERRERENNPSEILTSAVQICMYQ